LSQWAAIGSEPGVTDNAHQIDVDNDGNFYVADANNNRVQKFVPKKNAGKAGLIGRELVLKK
jgi:tripartite motif-containing protein 71